MLFGSSKKCYFLAACNKPMQVSTNIIVTERQSTFLLQFRNFPWVVFLSVSNFLKARA